MAPLSIVHLTTSLRGGAGRAIVDLACAQRHAGHDVLVATAATGEPQLGNYPHHLERLRTEGLPVLLDDSLFPATPSNQRPARLLDVRSPDTVNVVHAHSTAAAHVGLGYARGASRRVAVVQTQHGWGSNDAPDHASLAAAIVPDLDGVIVTSESVGRILAGAGLSRDHITTIPHGLPARPPAGVPDEARRCLGPLRGAGRRIIGCVGSVTPYKNQALIVEALARTTDTGLTAVFIGEGGAALADLANERGVRDRVHPLGYRPGAERWMPLFNLLVVPSLRNLQGLVILEAFRAGVPVAASDVPAMQELVSDGETGWLFDPKDPQALADTMQRALHAMTAARARVAQAARQVFLERYTLEDTIASHETLYRRLLQAIRPAVGVATL